MTVCIELGAVYLSVVQTTDFIQLSLLLGKGSVFFLLLLLLLLLFSFTRSCVSESCQCVRCKAKILSFTTDTVHHPTSLHPIPLHSALASVFAALVHEMWREQKWSTTAVAAIDQL
jgi:hypothetical protein